MKNTAPLSTPTSSRSRPSYSREISAPSSRDPRLQRLLLDQDLPDRLARPLIASTSPLLPSRAPRRSPAPRPPRSPATTSGQSSRSALGTFASTNRSCTFLRRPASRSPGRRARTSSPGRSRLDRPGPPLARLPSSRSVLVLADGADAAAEVGRLRPPRGSRAARRACARACAGASAARRRARGATCAPAGRAARAAAGSRRGSGRASCRGSRSPRGTRSPRSSQYARVSSRQTPSSGRTTPSSRFALIRCGEPEATSPSRTASTWSDAVCPVARSRSVAKE